uniref:beta strand repeat-containing protein n=1 Tax=Paractinoplanes polyasparticus TaxID=2856853 RepID=UPI001C853EA3|nr:IPT/TIG domain-containing protein [Actinoplanes polyasparticus]
MRKSSNSRTRLAVAAGLTTSAVGAALLVTPGVAFAATTVTPTVVAPGGSVTIYDDTATFSAGVASPPSGALNRVQILTTGTTCVTPIPAASTTVVAATVTESSVANDTVTFTVPSTLPAGTNGTAKRYVVCVYEPTGVNANARVGQAGGYTITVGAPPVVTPAFGTTGGGNQITVSTGTAGNIFTGVATVTAAFNTDAMCAAALGTPVTGTSTVATKTSDSSVNITVPSGVALPGANFVKYNLCLYNGTTATSALLTAANYTVSQVQMSANTGSWLGTNGLNITAPNPILAGFDSPGAMFVTATTCPAYDSTPALGTSVPVTGSNAPRKVADNRLALTVPQLYTNVGAWNSARGTRGSMPWQLCIYGSATNTEAAIAAAPYSATTLHTIGGVTPRAGTALGGSRITVSGTAFPTEAGEITATLGGSPLINITPLTSTAFSATTTAHIPANNSALVVSTNAGSVTYQNAYTFTSALSVKPNTAPNTRSIDVVVNGLGFQSSTWNSGDLTGAHIYLVNGVYSSSNVGGARANPPTAECSSVLVLTDSELICRLDLTSRLNAGGTAALSVAPDPATIDTTAGSRVATGALALAGTNFSSLDLGKTITDPAAAPSLPAGTTIVGILGNDSVLLSNAASATTNDAPVVISARGPLKTITGTTADGAATLTSISPGLEAADENRFVFGPSIPATGLTLTGTIAPNATSGTLSGTVTTGIAGATLSVFAATATVPVPEGAYNLTYVSNGSVNAVSNDASFIQSGISSSSTFTVAQF